MRVWWIGLVAACGGAKEPECEPTIAAAIDRMVRSERSEAIIAAAPRLKHSLIAACVADRWSAEVLRCLSGATLQPDVIACTRKLTVEQHERIGAKLVFAPAPVDPYVVDAAIAELPALDGELGPNPYIDAGIAAVVDAPPAITRTRPGPPRDCRNVVVDPKDRACREQYCKAHPTDIRCDTLE